MTSKLPLVHVASGDSQPGVTEMAYGSRCGLLWVYYCALIELHASPNISVGVDCQQGAADVAYFIASAARGTIMRWIGG